MLHVVRRTLAQADGPQARHMFHGARAEDMAEPQRRSGESISKAAHGGGWGPVASPVFKTAWAGVSPPEGSTPFLLRQTNRSSYLALIRRKFTAEDAAREGSPPVDRQPVAVTPGQSPAG